jgi:hypothetical protein
MMMADGELRDTGTAHHDALTPPKKKKKHAHRSIHPDARDRDFQRVRATTMTTRSIDRSIPDHRSISPGIRF